MTCSQEEDMAHDVPRHHVCIAAQLRAPAEMGAFTRNLILYALAWLTIF
jgi:hypothetical protein